ncbi:MAG: GNAT family N-acetyltransferase [Pseudobdellovibrionaceae bacterium]|nr:GNAT family N-acetyltransferase [Pseudobdellovibrionaceae bacterium]
MNTDQDIFFLLDAAVPEQRAQWLDLWRRWPHRDVVAHVAYAQLFARPKDRVVCACQMDTEGGILFPLIVRPLRVEPWGIEESETCDLVSPYGYGGPFGWGSFQVEAFWMGFERWARAIHAVSLFARLSLFKDQLIPFYGETLVKGPCVIVSLKQEPADILQGYEKHARENVRQAKREGITVEPDPDCRRLEEFLGVYSATMNRLGALSMYYFPKSFFERLIAELPQEVILFHATHNHRVLSTELLLISEHYLYAFLGGTLEEGFPLRANPLLRHEINVWARANGKQQVVLGGGYSGQDGLLRYKQRYAPDGHVSFRVGTRVFDSTSYEALTDTRAAWEFRQGNQWSPRGDFFPAYRG